MLKIRNYEKLKDMEFRCNSTEWKVGEVGEGPEYYQIALFPKMYGVFSIMGVEFVYLQRSLMDTGYEYGVACPKLGSNVIYPIHCFHLASPDDLLVWLNNTIIYKLC